METPKPVGSQAPNNPDHAMMQPDLDDQRMGVLLPVNESERAITDGWRLIRLSDRVLLARDSPAGGDWCYIVACITEKGISLAGAAEAALDGILHDSEGYVRYTGRR